MNKNILIIGGTSGIGKALVELLQDSNQLFVANRTSEGLDTGKVTCIPFDATTDVLDTTQLPRKHQPTSV
jgi:3-oxoacyl-[acyl-carrier protein] reductase